MTSSSQFTNSLTVPQTSARQNSSLEHTPLGILSSTKKTRQTARMTTGGRPPRRPIIREDDTTSASLPQVPMAPSRSRQTATLVASDSPPPPQPDTDRVHSKRSPLGSDVAKTVGRRQTARMSTGCRPPRREPAIQNSVRPLSDSDRHSESSSGPDIGPPLGSARSQLPAPETGEVDKPCADTVTSDTDSSMGSPFPVRRRAFTKLQLRAFIYSSTFGLLTNTGRSFRRAQSENSDSAGDEQTQPVPGYLSLSGRGRIFKLVKRTASSDEAHSSPVGGEDSSGLARGTSESSSPPPDLRRSRRAGAGGRAPRGLPHPTISESAGDESDGGDSMGSFIVADDLDSDDSQEVAVTYRKGDISATAQVHVTPQSRTGSVAQSSRTSLNTSKRKRSPSDPSPQRRKSARLLGVHNQVFFDDEAEESDEGSGGSDDSGNDA